MVVKRVHGYVHFEHQPTTIELKDEAGNCWGIYDNKDLADAEYLKDLLNSRHYASLMDRDNLRKD